MIQMCQDHLEDFQLDEIMNLPEDVLIGAFMVDRPKIYKLMRMETLVLLDCDEPEPEIKVDAF